MGCDFYWNALEPDLTWQRQAGWLLQSIARKNNWEHRVFNGEVDGCFLYHQVWPPKELLKGNPQEWMALVVLQGMMEGQSLNPHTENLQGFAQPPPLTARKATLNLMGVTLFYESAVQKMSDDESDLMWGVAEHQCSFVFNNTASLPDSPAHELVTIEFIKDFTWPRYAKYCSAFAELGAATQTTPCAILRPGSRDRNSVAGAIRALALALALKRQCLPNLEVGDDYSMFEELLAKDAPIHEDYLLSLADSSLRSFWGI